MIFETKNISNYPLNLARSKKIISIKVFTGNNGVSYVVVITHLLFDIFEFLAVVWNGS